MVLIFLTREYIGSGNCQREYVSALVQYRKPVVLLVETETDHGGYECLDDFAAAVNKEMSHNNTWLPGDEGRHPFSLTERDEALGILLAAATPLLGQKANSRQSAAAKSAATTNETYSVELAVEWYREKALKRQALKEIARVVLKFAQEPSAAPYTLEYLTAVAAERTVQCEANEYGSPVSCAEPTRPASVSFLTAQASIRFSKRAGSKRRSSGQELTRQTSVQPDSLVLQPTSAQASVTVPATDAQSLPQREKVHRSSDQRSSQWRAVKGSLLAFRYECEGWAQGQDTSMQIYVPMCRNPSMEGNRFLAAENKQLRGHRGPRYHQQVLTAFGDVRAQGRRVEAVDIGTASANIDVPLVLLLFPELFDYLFQEALAYTDAEGAPPRKLFDEAHVRTLGVDATGASAEHEYSVELPKALKRVKDADPERHLILQTLISHFDPNVTHKRKIIAFASTEVKFEVCSSRKDRSTLSSRASVTATDMRWCVPAQEYIQAFKASEHRPASAAEVIGPTAARAFFSILFAKWPDREGSRVLRTAALHEALPPRSPSRILASDGFGVRKKQHSSNGRSHESASADSDDKISCPVASESPLGRGREKSSVKWEDVDTTDIDVDVLSNDSDSFKIADRKSCSSYVSARRSKGKSGFEAETPPMEVLEARAFQLAPEPLPHGELGRMSARAKGMVARAERRHGVLPASWAARTATSDVAAVAAALDCNETTAAVIIQSATRSWLARWCVQRRRRQRANQRLLTHPLLAKLSSQDLKMLTREKVIEEQSQARQHLGERHRDLRRRPHRDGASEGDLDASSARPGRLNA